MVAQRTPAPSIEELALLISTATPAELARCERTSAGSCLPTTIRGALAALATIYAGEAVRGIELLRKRLRSPLGPYHELFVDALIGVLITRGDYQAVSAIVHSSTGSTSPVLRASLLAAEALISSHSGAPNQAARLLKRGIRRWELMTEPALRMRAASRLAIAAFSIGDYENARMLAHETIMTAERFNALRSVLYGYSVLRGIAHLYLQDKDLSAQYSARLIVAADATGDVMQQRYALVVQGWTAFEFGEIDRFKACHEELLKRPLPEQVAEGFTAGILDAVSLALSGKFDPAARFLLKRRSNTTRFNKAEQSLHSAIEAACYLATGDDDGARRLARQALALTAGIRQLPDVVEWHDGSNARLISAAVCYYLGDRTRGRRAVSRKLDPSGTFISALHPNHIERVLVPNTFHGYAQLLEQAIHARTLARSTVPLTKKEQEVFVALLTGDSKAAIATALGKSKYTVSRQAESIYRKLGVRSRPELMLRAAEMGLGPFRRLS